MSKGRILVVDDEKNIRRLIKSEFSQEGYEVVAARTGEEGLKVFDEQRFHVVLLDIKLPNMNGVEVLRKLKKKYPSAEIIMFTAYGDISTAVECMKLGARDYLTKPFKLSELSALVRLAMGENNTAPAGQIAAALPGKEAGFINCPSPAMQAVYDLAARVAPTNKTILIQGETGVGKDVVARQIHLLSPRKKETFVTIDCGMLSHNLAESELYGHGKGAFSGAADKKVGLVEESHKGTLFLDEIGNIDLELQKKLLRFLETGTFRRVGENREIKVDARIVLATNLDLAQAVSQGNMRKDLFYRMDVICIQIPPIRERSEDVIPLFEHFLDLDSEGLCPKKIAPDTRRVLMGYQWPGNIRELRSVASKSMIFASAGEITPDDLPAHMKGRSKTPIKRTQSLEEVEKEHIMVVLKESGGNQSQAAKILGINRKTLYKKMHKYQILTN